MAAGKEPKFVRRLARLPEVIGVIASYPEGIEIDALARQFKVPADDLRQDLLTFMEFESEGWARGFNDKTLEFVGGGWDPASDTDVFDLPMDTDDPDSLVVRVIDDAPTAAMGVEHLSAGDLALLYTAGLACLDAEPGDTLLAEALEVISATMYGAGERPEEVEPSPAYSPAEWARFVPLLQDAQESRRLVDIVYSREWQPGVSERTIEPLRVVQTRRGWEVDAGPVQADGSLRTFLLSNVRSADVLDATFEEPGNLAHRLERQRRTTTVRMELSQQARWAADFYAEKVSVLGEDEETFEVDLELLPPAAERVALLMLASGGEARLVEATHLMVDATAYIEGLIEHHES